MRPRFFWFGNGGAVGAAVGGGLKKMTMTVIKVLVPAAAVTRSGFRISLRTSMIDGCM